MTTVQRAFPGLLLVAILGLNAGSPSWGADDTEPRLHHPPLSVTEYRTLNIGFDARTWISFTNPDPCYGACTSRITYKSLNSGTPVPHEQQEFNLRLGSSGPLSFGISDKGLRMEVTF